MSILDRLFKKKPAIELNDPVFGRVTFDQGIWTFIPSPPTEGFMITIDAPETGPTAEQRAAALGISTTHGIRATHRTH